MNERVPVKSTTFTFKLVDRLLELNQAGASQLAEEFDMPTSTVHDHLRTLDQLGYLTNTGGQYRLSTRFLEIGNRVKHDMEIYRTSQIELKKLADETGAFTSLMIEEDGLGVIICMEKGDMAMNVNIDRIFPGTRTRLHTTALGKAILATLPSEHTLEIVDEYKLSPKTDRTITTSEALLEELETVRERGYAIDDQERFEGMRGVGVSLQSPRENITGAIGLYGPANYMIDDRFRDEIPQLVLKAANVIQVSLNYS